MDADLADWIAESGYPVRENLDVLWEQGVRQQLIAEMLVLLISR